MNIFKRFNKAVTEVIATDTQVIERIHNEFDTAAENALAEATAILNGTKSIPKEKAELMQKLGFINTREVNKVQEVNNILTFNKNKAEIVNKYSEKYPQYKFIFWDQVESICNKYNLICGQSHLYKGDIPYKNLQEIADFNVNPEDTYYIDSHDQGYSWFERYKEISSSGKWINEAKSRDYSKLEFGPNAREHYRNNFKLPFFICAPLKDMKTEGYKKNGAFLEREIPDPIVLHPMKDGALIVSKWGIEAEDEMLK